MTKDELEVLKRLTEAATKAPWVAHRHSGKHAEGSEIEGPGGVAITSGDPYEAVANENADFIVAARTAVPALLEDLEVARTEKRMFARAAKEAQEECLRLRRESLEVRDELIRHLRAVRRGACWCDGGEQHDDRCLMIKEFVDG